MNLQSSIAFASFALTMVMTVCPPPCLSAQLKPETVQAFDQYIHTAETHMDADLRTRQNFLWADSQPQPAQAQLHADLLQGQVIIRDLAPGDSALGLAVPGGLIHDWIGTVFLPRVSISQTLRMLQDYDHDQDYYRPEVLRSRLLSHNGNNFHVFLRVKRSNVITVVFNTEYDVHYFVLDPTHAHSASRSTRIAEVDNPDQPTEREKTVGDDNGFLWRLYSYWRFYQADAGTFIQCEAVSLSRDVLTGFNWIVKPFIKEIPAESLRFTLEATRNAITESSANLLSFDSSNILVEGGKYVRRTSSL